MLTAADALLAIAPQHAAAGQARRRAWKAVGMDVTQPCIAARPARAGVARLDNVRPAAADGGPRVPASRSSEVDTVAGNEHPQRALLWVDAVGGFLVCLDDAIVLGQPSPGESIARADPGRPVAAARGDSPRRGRLRARAAAAVRVDGREITGPTVLADNQLIQLGDNVRMRFTKPHALSATARLDFESHHKTQPIGRRRAADGRQLRAGAEPALPRPLPRLAARCRRVPTK